MKFPRKSIPKGLVKFKTKIKKNRYIGAMKCCLAGAIVDEPDWWKIPVYKREGCVNNSILQQAVIIAQDLMVC